MTIPSLLTQPQPHNFRRDNSVPDTDIRRMGYGTNAIDEPTTFTQSLLVPESSSYSSSNSTTQFHTSSFSSIPSPPPSSSHSKPYNPPPNNPLSSYLPRSAYMDIEAHAPPDPPPALARYLQAQPNVIGQPVTFARTGDGGDGAGMGGIAGGPNGDGYYDGKTIRAEIVEIQGANLGRKCADASVEFSGTIAASDARGAVGRKSASMTPLSPRSTRSGSATMMDVDGNGAGESNRDLDRGEGPSLPSATSTVTGKRKRKDAKKDKDTGKEKEKGTGKKDRRPVDPPPVVKMRLFEVVDRETGEERELAAKCVLVYSSTLFFCFSFVALS